MKSFSYIRYLQKVLRRTLAKTAKFKKEEDLNSGNLKHVICKQITYNLEKAEVIEFGKQENLQEQT